MKIIIRSSLLLLCMVLSESVLAEENKSNSSICDKYVSAAEFGIKVKHMKGAPKEELGMYIAWMIGKPLIEDLKLNGPERLQFGKEIALAGPYESKEQEIKIASLYFGTSCDLKMNGSAVKAYSKLTEKFKNCTKLNSDVKVKECFVKTIKI